MKGWRGSRRTVLRGILTHSSAVRGAVNSMIRGSTGVGCVRFRGGVHW